MVKYFVKKNHFTGTWTVYRAPEKREDTTDLIPWERVCGWLDTWREAIDYADKRSRTVEVTLPPVESHPSGNVPGPAWHASENLVSPWVSTVDRQIWRTDHRGFGNPIGANTAERLGLALIAAAKHAKGELP